MLEMLDVPLCTSLRLVFPSLRCVDKLLDTSTGQPMLFLPTVLRSRILITLMLMACPSLTTVHLANICGPMLQVLLRLAVGVHHLALVLQLLLRSHLRMLVTIITANLGM